LRISFGGGGTDVSPYCDERGGAVLSSTVNRFAYASLLPATDTISVRSIDYDVSVAYDLDEPFVYDGQLDLAKTVVDHFRRNHTFESGLEIVLHNDAPPGSGLGSSSAIVVAMISAFAEYLGLRMSSYEIAELAFKLERVDAGIGGGRQDQFATTFGGFNFIEFERESTVVTPLRVRPETLLELEYGLVFAYVGGTHFSAHIIERQVDNYTGGVTDSIAAMDRLKQIAVEMRRALALGDLAGFGGLLDEAWLAKRAMAEGISTPRLDSIYDAAKAAGALGGKVSGAGGGGFMFFLADPERRFAVQEAVKAHGGELVALSFVDEGVRAWRT
jgi:D-glycero-alpha-D-manno-heptose-7-phosphate kinase